MRHVKKAFVNHWVSLTSDSLVGVCLKTFDGRSMKVVWPIGFESNGRPKSIGQPSLTETSDFYCRR